MKKYLSASLVLLAAAFSVQGCEREYDSKHFIPGVYETESSRDSTIGYGTARVTIKNRRITAIEYHSYTPDGKLKDAEYWLPPDVTLIRCWRFRIWPWLTA